MLDDVWWRGYVVACERCQMMHVRGVRGSAFVCKRLRCYRVHAIGITVCKSKALDTANCEQRV